VSVVMMMMGWGWLRAWAWLRAWSRLRAVAVGPMLIAGRYAVITAPEFGSGTPAHFFVGVVRGWFRFVATRVGRLVLPLPLGRIQPKHVEQDGGHIRHHDEGDEHDEPRENGEAADAQLIQQNGKNGHHNHFQKRGVLLPPK